MPRNRNTVTEEHKIFYTDRKGRERELGKMTEDDILDELIILEHRRKCLMLVAEATRSPAVRSAVSYAGGSISALVEELDNRLSSEPTGEVDDDRR